MSPQSPPYGNTLRQPAVPSNSYMTFLVLIKKKSELKPNYYGTLLSLGWSNCSWGGLERVLRAGFRKWFPLRALSNGASANLIMSGKGVNVTQLHVSERLHLISRSLLRSLSHPSLSFCEYLFESIYTNGADFCRSTGMKKNEILSHRKDGRVGKAHIWVDESERYRLWKYLLLINCKYSGGVSDNSVCFTSRGHYAVLVQVWKVFDVVIKEYFRFSTS